MKNNGLAVAFLLFVCAFGWQMSDILQHVASWDVFWNPPTVGDVLRAMTLAGLAFGVGLGIDVRALLSGIGIKFGGQ